MNLKALIMIKSFNSCIKEAEKRNNYKKENESIYGIGKEYWRSSKTAFWYPTYTMRFIFRNKHRTGIEL